MWLKPKLHLKKTYRSFSYILLYKLKKSDLLNIFLLLRLKHLKLSIILKLIWPLRFVLKKHVSLSFISYKFRIEKYIIMFYNSTFIAVYKNTHYIKICQFFVCILFLVASLFVLKSIFAGFAAYLKLNLKAKNKKCYF